MDQWQTVTQRLARSIPQLSPRLRRVAHYVLEHPGDVATMSMRKLSSAVGVPPTTTSRLPRAVGFESWETFRDVFRDNLRASSYSTRAAALQESGALDHAELLWRGMRESSRDNLEHLFDSIDANKTAEVADTLAAANKVHVVGMQSSSFFAGYLHYVAQMAFPNWHLVSGSGGELADDTIAIESGDAVVAIAFSSYARGTVEVARHGFAQGASIVAITDSLNSPLVPYAVHTLLVSTRSPHFFESYIAAAALIEVVVAQLVSHAGDPALGRIEALEQLREELGEYWETRD